MSDANYNHKANADALRDGGTAAILSISDFKGGLDIPASWTSQEVDGATAIGFKLNTVNPLSTELSKLFSLQNDSVEYVGVRRGTDLWDDADSILLEINGIGGLSGLQFTVDQTNDFVGLFTQRPEFTIISGTFGAYAANFSEALLTFSHRDAVAGTMVALQTIDATNTFASSLQVMSGADSTGDGFAEWEINATRGDGLQNKMYFRSHSTNDPFSLHFDFLATEGLFAIDSTGRVKGYGVGAARTKWEFLSLATDGATSVGYDLDTANGLVTSGALLLSLKNDGVEKFAVDKDGNISVAGTQVVTSQQSAVADAAVVTTTGTNTGTAGAGLSLIGDTSAADQSGAIMNDLVALQEDILDLRTQLNEALAVLRAHGLIAT